MSNRSFMGIVLATALFLGCDGAPKSRADAGAPAAAGSTSPPSGPASQPSSAARTPGASGSVSAAGAGSELKAPRSAHMGMATFPDDEPNQDVAIFAGGCFWCVEVPFEEIDGVYTAISGYTAGHVDDPTYELINTHTTGHLEAVWVAFDSTKVSYADLLKVFWRNIDPTTADRQFCDRGDTYQSAIFHRNAGQKALAEASRVWAMAQLKVKEPIVTPIRPAARFWPAEVYHQDYHRKKPIEYGAYRLGCGRDARLKQLWGAAAAH